MDCIDMVPEEIEELANVAREAYYLSPLPVRASWHEVVKAVLRKRQEQAMRRLYRDVIEVKEHSYSCLAWIEDGQVKCCSSLCREDETCDQCETHGCRPVLVYEEEVLCRG